MQGRGGGDESWIGFLHPSEQGQGLPWPEVASPANRGQEQMLDHRQGGGPAVEILILWIGLIKMHM